MVSTFHPSQQLYRVDIQTVMGILEKLNALR